MYQLPLRFIKVSDDVSVCATRIVAMMSTNAYQARRTISDEKKAGTLINAAGRGKANTAIFLDNGSVIASPVTINRLMKAIEKASSKSETPNAYTSISPRLRVYEATLEEPDPKEDVDEVSQEDVSDQTDEPQE